MSTTTSATALYGNLVLTICDAKDLHSDYGKSEPYCNVSLGGKLWTTQKGKQGNLNPTWKESRKIFLSGTPLNAKLTVALFDNDLYKDRPVGCAEIQLSNLLATPTTSYYALESEGRLAGYIGLLANFFA